MRLMFWYGLMPVVVIVGTLVFLTMPYLVVAVLAIVALGALAALAWAIVAVPYMLSRAISRRWHGRSGASPRTAAAPPVYGFSAGGRDGAPGQPTYREGHVS